MTAMGNPEMEERFRSDKSNGLPESFDEKPHQVRAYDNYPAEAPQALRTEEDPAQSPQAYNIAAPLPVLSPSDLPRSNQDSSVASTLSPDKIIDTEEDRNQREPKDSRRICGLSRAAFFAVLVIVLVIVVAAAVGGGVGGSMRNRNNNSALPVGSPTTGTSDSMASTTQDTTASATSSEPPRITGWSLTAYSGSNFTGASRVYDEVGFYEINFAPSGSSSASIPVETASGQNSSFARSYRWAPSDSGCCVRYCINRTPLGYRCVTPTENPVYAYDRVILSCGGC